MTAVIPLSLYMHFPWCVQKCPYCDFNSHENKHGINEDTYVQALIADLEHQLPDVWGRPIESIFMGGGTPSLFSGQAIDHLLAEIRARLSIKPDTEITLEANPGTVDSPHFQEYFQAGINRLSLGVQSLNDAILKQLGRIHNSEEVLKAYDQARAAGFENINLDLMFGLPSQSISSALQELEQIIQLRPQHISYYQLTIEPNTWFFKHPPSLPADDTIIDTQQAAIELMRQHGYQRYEISAFAQANRQARHNLNYWRYGDYLGIGAGAHSKLTMQGKQQIHRRVKIKQPDSYIKHAGTDDVYISQQQINKDERAFEFMMNALRLVEGFDLNRFEERTYLNVDQIMPQLYTASESGLIELNGSHVQPTQKGLDFLNNLLEMFLPNE